MVFSIVFVSLEPGHLKAVWSRIAYTLLQASLKNEDACLVASVVSDSTGPYGLFMGFSRILKWVAVHSSRGSYQPRDGTHKSYVYLHCQAGSLPLTPPGKSPFLKEKKNEDSISLVRFLQGLKVDICTVLRAEPGPSQALCWL